MKFSGILASSAVGGNDEFSSVTWLPNSSLIGLDRKSFDNKHVTFEDHIRKVHNMWNYVYFMVLINVKDPTEYTGPESYVHEMIEVRSSLWAIRSLTSNIVSVSPSSFQQRNLDWFPRMRTSSLDIQEDKNKEDQDNRILKIQMEDANKAIKTLTMELTELQKMVNDNPPTPSYLHIISSFYLQVTDSRAQKHRMNFLQNPAIPTSLNA